MQNSIAPFENRLIDAFEHLIDLRKDYFQPQRFRRTLNATIQALRNVTFVLQKCAKKLEGFRNWYEVWQEKMKADPTLKWLINSRNTVVKEGDLETHSVAKIKIYRDWNEPPLTTVEVSPNLLPEEYASRLSSVISGNLIEEGALLYVERCWIDQNFPDREIVTLLDHCAKVFRELMLSFASTFNITFTAELINTINNWEKVNSDFRTCWFKLENNQVIETESIEIKTDDHIINLAKDRFHIQKEQLLEIPLHTPFQQQCGEFFKQGLAMLRCDGLHRPIAILIGQNKNSQILGLPMEDRAEKHFQLRQLAEKISKQDFQAVIIINEAWIAFPKGRVLDHAANYPDRSEALALSGVTCEGECFNILQIFERSGEIIWFPHHPHSDIALPNVMKPIYNSLVRV